MERNWRELLGYEPRGILLWLDMTDKQEDPLAIATALGINVYTVRYEKDKEKEGELHWANKVPEIYVNVNRPERQRFVIVKALGELFARGKGDTADLFAMQFLVPSWLVNYEILTNEDISLKKLANKFNVSEKFMKIRLKYMDLITSTFIF